MRRTIRLALLALLSVYLALPIGASADSRGPRAFAARSPRLLVWGANASTVLSTNNCLLSTGIVTTLQNCAANPHAWVLTGIPFAGGPYYLGRLTCVMGTAAGMENGDKFAVKVQQLTADGFGNTTMGYLGSAIVSPPINDVTGTGPYTGSVFSGTVGAWTAAEGALELRLGGYTDTGNGMDTRAVCSLEVW